MSQGSGRYSLQLIIRTVLTDREHRTTRLKTSLCPPAPCGSKSPATFRRRSNLDFQHARTERTAVLALRGRARPLPLLRSTCLSEQRNEGRKEAGLDDFVDCS